MIQASDISVRIVSRVHASDGHRFCEVLYSFDDAGTTRHALTRHNFELANTDHIRAVEAMQFARRRNRNV